MAAVLLSLPVIVSALLMAAHFVFHGQPILAFGSLAVLSLLLVPRPWAARVLQMLLAGATMEWILTLIHLVRVRVEAGRSWALAAVILALVAAFTLWSALVFQRPALRRRFGLDQASRRSGDA